MKGGKIMMTGSYDVESWLLLEGLAVDLRTHICRILNENLFQSFKRENKHSGFFNWFPREHEDTIFTKMTYIPFKYFTSVLS